MSKLTVAQQTGLRDIVNRFEWLIDDWSYDRLLELSPFLRKLEGIVQEKMVSKVEAYSKQQQVKADTRFEKQQQRNKKVEKRVREIGDDLIGKIIKANGTRDGHGFRQVISINYQRQEVTCHQFDRSRGGLHKVVKDGVMYANLQCYKGNLFIRGVTTHAFSNITHYNPTGFDAAITHCGQDTAVVTVEPIICE